MADDSPPELQHLLDDALAENRRLQARNARLEQFDQSTWRGP